MDFLILHNKLFKLVLFLNNYCKIKLINIYIIINISIIIYHINYY